MASPVVGAAGSPVERARRSGWRPVSGAPRAWTVLRSGVTDSAVVAVAGGVSAGLVPPGLGLPSSGVGLRSSGVGEAEAVAVECRGGRGRLRHRNCRANDGEQCRSRPDDRGAPAEARNDVAAVGDHGADYRPGAMAADYHPASGRAGLPPGPTEPATESGPRSPRGVSRRRRWRGVRSRAVGARSASGGRRLVARWSGRGVRCGLSLFGRCR